ncbi:MAG: carbon storage regulator [Ignavibacteria bacterium]|jgi:carbon storage regulator|nr:carbon storage regulator [Ignavibacteria bacterium]MCU7501934.1 carbon storage regulator [Ignavibacteria bacterium]MCU7514720.1 carbon storage regulator [Ignavibacteria bacterium]
MLILSRKLNDEIRINGDIVIKIVALSDNQVKIGIDAPSDIKILRGEVYEKVRDYAIEASQKSKEKVPVDLTKLKVNKIKK